MFNEFHQLDNPERDRQKGLGLAIVKQTCALLTHPLSLTSAPNQGCQFDISVPESQSPQSVTVASVAPVNALKNKKLLCIDDEVAITDAMKLLLTQWGANVTIAATKQDIEKLIEMNYLPDAIISDYRLPDHQTGAMLIAMFRDANKQDIPAMLITGDTAKDRINEARDTGLILLHKPIQPARLRIALTKLLSTSMVS